MSFIETYQFELISTGILIFVVLVIRALSHLLVNRIGQKNGVNNARIKLICRYITATLLILALTIEAVLLGVDFKDMTFILSSVFAVIGIGLFAIWSILSNVTSGIIMFFSFPYKVGDKIKIHDNDFPVEAVIEDIRAFHLHLRKDDGDLVTYPNNLILQKAVTLVEKNVI